MTTALAVLLLIWAALSALATWRASRKEEPPLTINGMRRRRSGETRRAWAAGVRATYKFMYGLPMLLVVASGVFFAIPDEYLWPAIGVLTALVLAQMVVVLRLLDTAISRATAEELAGNRTPRR